LIEATLLSAAFQRRAESEKLTPKPDPLAFKF